MEPSTALWIKLLYKFSSAPNIKSKPPKKIVPVLFLFDKGKENADIYENKSSSKVQ